MFNDPDLAHCSKTVLVVANSYRQFKDSSVLACFNLVNISASVDTVSWIQQHQPDLIILDLDWSQVAHLQLISGLRMDWLTRLIPIMAIVGSKAQLISTVQLDYDVCLLEPYSQSELEKSICDLISLPACELQNKMAV